MQNKTLKTLVAPKPAAYTRSDIVLPACIWFDRSQLPIMPQHDIASFLVADLTTPRLDKMHDHLWLSGLPLPSRPLHRQRMMGREICLTERPDEHLVWHRTRIWLKPLPAYLLCPDFWDDHLCHDQQLHASAAGFLLSYMWLISYQSDFTIARETKLIPDDLEWPQWTDLSQHVLQSLANTITNKVENGPASSSTIMISKRYQYGELRLSRLNSMTRFLPAMWSWRNFRNQHMIAATWYQDYFARNFSWILAVFVYLSAALSAMQVALAIPRLSESAQFEGLSYWFSILTIAVVFASAGVIALMWVALFWVNLLGAISTARSRLQRGFQGSQVAA